MLSAQPAPVQSGRSYTVTCDTVNGVLHPSPMGPITAVIQENISPDGSKTASIQFGGQVQGFVTYGFSGGRPVSYQTQVDDPLGNVAQSIENIAHMM